MVGSPSKKIVAKMKYLGISWELLMTNMLITYPTWTIIIPTLSIRSENADIEIQICGRHANEHTALEWLGGKFTGRKRWRCSLDGISKVYLDRHQKVKLKLKFHLSYLSDSYYQNIKKIVTWGLKSQKFYFNFPCNPMEPFISGVLPYVTKVV